MTKADAAFAGSIPALYDRYLVPMIFEPYATDMARRLAETKPRRVLETAAGTGVVTRRIAETLAGAEIVATDLNQPMIDFAASELSAPHVSWRQADATNLGFEDHTFDVVVCQFGAMFFPDRLRGYREARRVLRSGGRFVFNVWDRIEENEVALTVTQALAKFFPADPPQFLARTPHGHHDLARIRSELAAGGFGRIESETIAFRGKAASPFDAVVGYCQGSPLRNEIEGRGDLSAATDAAAAMVASRFGNGPIDAKIQAHVITAWA